MTAWFCRPDISLSWFPTSQIKRVSLWRLVRNSTVEQEANVRPPAVGVPSVFLLWPPSAPNHIPLPP